MNSVFARHYFWLASMLFITVVIMGVSFVAISGNYIAGQQLGQLSYTAQSNSEAASFYLSESGALGFPMKVLINSVATAQDSHIMVADADGTIVMCSDDLFCVVHVGKKAPQAFTQAVLTRYSAAERDIVLEGIYDDRRNVAAHAIMDASGEKAVGFVTVSMRATENRAFTGTLLRICLYVAAIVMLFASFSAYLVSKQLTKPLKAISRSTQSYARGDFSTRVPVDPNSHDEINTLCANFNSMADSLQRLDQLRHDFVANVSHELRTPMTVIAGYVDGVLDGAIPPGDSARYLTIVSEEVRRLSRLVARMLDISQMQSGQVDYSKRPVNLCEMVRRVILGFENRIEDKHIEVDCQLPSEDLNVLFDPDAITQVLTNLTDNAIKFTPPGGRLSIAVTHKGSRVKVAVGNTGPEIPESELPYIFDRFHKTDKSRGEDKIGLGLGLYIVRSILQSHDESIYVTSENGVTTFTFELPVVK